MEQRVASLEALLPSSKDTLSSHMVVAERLQQLEAELARIIKARPVLAELLSSTVAADLEERWLYLASDISVKLQVVLASSEHVRNTAHLLSEVATLENVVAADASQAAVPQLKPQVSKLQLAFVPLQQQLQQQQDELQRLLLSYNQTITLLSQKFLSLDEAISRLEAEV